MKILLACNHLFENTGSEIFLSTIYDFMKKKDQDVTLYSRSSKNNNKLRMSNYDIALCFHNICAMEIRLNFPKLPIVFLSNGVLPFLEKPPYVDINTSMYLAVSEEVYDFLRKFDVDNIKLFRNCIDSEKFYSYSDINTIPKKALIISNRITDDKANIIRKSCSNLGISCKFVGKKFGEVSQSDVPNLINNSDIVFSLGRGVIETLMCERVPIIYDYNGGDGVVNLSNVKELMKHNFSGRFLNKNFTVSELTKEISSYSTDNVKDLRNFAVNSFDASKNIDKLIKLFSSIASTEIENMDVDNLVLLDNIMASLDEASYYSKILEY